MDLEFKQTHLPAQIQTPLPDSTLLLRSFTGREAISQLFSFELDLIAQNHKTVEFEKLLGQKVTIGLEMPHDRGKRYWNGIVQRFSRGGRGVDFTSYRAALVPSVWLLTKITRARIFQNMAVPDILRKVFTGFDVGYELTGRYEPHDFCVQYRESDFDFASRLMEEEGIFYFFKHSSGGHKMVVADTPQSHPDLQPERDVIFEELAGGARDEERVHAFEKVQELRSGKYTLWDNTFLLPRRALDAEARTLESVQAGATTHKLNVGGNDKLELYDYPGGYALRYDSGTTPSRVQRVFEDNRRTVGIRMQQEAAPALTIEGNGNCRHFVSGYKFSLQRHFNDDGQYVITAVDHMFSQANEFSVEDAGVDAGAIYENRFECIPAALPYRPQRLTPVPSVHGTQTATVVGPAGEEIYTDEYARVKVQFHWDREGKNNADSSCWVRVATSWAGSNWGAISLPRIGQEVVVDFLEGNPDRPIVIGSVYNAEQMPPYALPAKRTQSTIKSRSSKGGAPSNFNEIRFEDLKGSEQMFLHGEKDMDLRVKNDLREFVKRDRHLVVEGSQKELVKGNKDVHAQGVHKQKVDGDVHLIAGGKRNEKVGTVLAVEAGTEIHLKAGSKIIIEGGQQVSIKGAGGFIDIGPAGVTIQGTMVKINSGGAAGSGSGSNPQEPADPDVADDGTKVGKLN
ncbi:MAG TPA: type VI secretion system tip protein TssI/VgrG [Bryobacteraceae bacterium]|nr:type VI secretion system tip protein TssI/VgrG [Bryobacteraceae bacterium]